MNIKKILISVVASFIIICALLVAHNIFVGCEGNRGFCTLLQSTPAETEIAGANEPAFESLIQDSNEAETSLGSAEFVSLRAEDAKPRSVRLGSTDPKSGYKFELELTSMGAGIERACLSEFDDKDPKDPKPLDIVHSLDVAGQKYIPMANGYIVFPEIGLQLRLDRLHWKTLPSEKTADGQGRQVRFEAVILDQNDVPAVRIIKLYEVRRDQYHLGCSLLIENLSPHKLTLYYYMQGPLGIELEAVRADMRKAMASFRSVQGDVVSVRKSIDDLRSAESTNEMLLKRDDGRFIWTAITNKYFTAIVVPEPTGDLPFCNWMPERRGQYFDPDGKEESGDETVGVMMRTSHFTLAPKGSPNSSSDYDFQIYLGPKDKRIFDNREMYTNLGFVQTIDFRSCCICPSSIITPLAFGVLAILGWMYGIIGNYGIAIIIFVLLVRLALHPITKKSQVSMQKMSKLGPKMQELKDRYGDNKQELNKKMMELYREEGFNPVGGMLPMFIQMPIWIALYSAIWTSVELRGEPFLPFWITDLSAPDALFYFPEFTIPIINASLNSFNLLPILMGVAMFLQQQLMGTSQAAASPQAAQQQKMMKIMLPVMLPVILYKAPSGLNLYIMSSVFAGVIEQYFIRKHIREKEETQSQTVVEATKKTGGKAKKKKPKPYYRNM